jgi:hypothetical protein
MKLVSFTHYSHNDGAITLPMPILSQSFGRDGEWHMGAFRCRSAASLYWKP